MSLTNAQMRDVEGLLHPYANAAAIRQNGSQNITKGEGVYVYDDEGKRYIEGLAGLWSAGLGFSNEELVEAAREQMARLPYYHVFSGRTHEPAFALAEKLKELLPTQMSRVIYATSGSEANDTQLKLLWYYNNARGKPEKKKVLSRKKAYHGVTAAAASMTGLPFNHMSWDLPFRWVDHLGTPHFAREAVEGENEAEFVARLARELEEHILAEGPDSIAAMIAEPVMGAGGVIIPPEGYFPAIGKVLDKYDIRLISDEVITGFGRTGEWFGAGRFGMSPHSYSMAKQLTASFLPLSAVAIDAEMTEMIEAHSSELGVLGHGYTYGGHPVSCAVALKAIEIYERENIVARVRENARHFARHLARISGHELVVETRHVGMIAAIELGPGKRFGFEPAGKLGARMFEEMRSRGVIIRAIVDAIAFCPPMIASEEEIGAMFEPVEASLDAVLVWAKGEGIL